MGRSGRSGGGGGNSWNSFQHSHAGQGYSSSQMSAMYHASGGGHSSGSGYAAAAPSYSGSYYQPSTSYSSYVAPAQPSHHTPSSSESSSSKTWNQFQHKHAGQGWSKERMQEEYHSAQTLPAVKSTATPSDNSGMRGTHFSIRMQARVGLKHACRKSTNPALQHLLKQTHGMISSMSMVVRAGPSSRCSKHT